MGDVELIPSIQHGRIICTSKFCSVALEPEQLNHHINRHHPSSKDPAVVEQILEQMRGCEVVKLANLVNPICPFPYLPVYDGFKCSLCPEARYFTNVKGYRHHLTHAHSEKGLDVNTAKFKVQKLNHREKGSLVFPVANPDSIILNDYNPTYDSVFGDIDPNYNIGKLPKCVKALGWFSYFADKNWDTEWDAFNKTEYDNADLVLAIKFWLKGGIAKLVEDGSKMYDLMLHLGYEKL